MRSSGSLGSRIRGLLESAGWEELVRSQPRAHQGLTSGRCGQTRREELRGSFGPPPAAVRGNQPTVEAFGRDGGKRSSRKRLLTLGGSNHHLSQERAQSQP